MGVVSSFLLLPTFPVPRLVPQSLVGENIFLPNIPGSYNVADCTTLRERWMLCCTFHSICPSAAVYFSALVSVLLHVYVSLSLSSVLFASLSDLSICLNVFVSNIQLERSAVCLSFSMSDTLNQRFLYRNSSLFLSLSTFDLLPSSPLDWLS